ncbi:hypothetical protein [Thiohalophilus sp.]|uniref:hypothetical protein n=1 Tax=Thiohalophilus sp. TaxID=3028392 RepID=UPI002ACEC831|nr:hypothetical protein [Thiohalophilus sp.]MDZ7663598.1 hypothetical protein [Thiohalophilus sp.]
MIWNYKFLVTIFSSLRVDEKFTYISTFLYPDIYKCLLIGAIYPLVTAIAFIFIYPYPAKLVYSFARERQKELKEIKQRIEDETPLTHEESRKIRRKMAVLEIEHENEIERKNAEIQRLKDLADELSRDNESEPRSDSKLSSDSKIDDIPIDSLNEEQLRLLELVSINDKPWDRRGSVTHGSTNNSRLSPTPFTP